jgi:hypothetical protein
VSIDHWTNYSLLVNIVNIVCPFWWIWTEVLSNDAVQPWSQNWPIEMRDPCWSLGKICALCAASGRLYIEKGVWVEQMRWPFGKPTVIPCVVGILLMQGLLSGRKCPVQLESVMVVSFEGAM